MLQTKKLNPAQKGSPVLVSFDPSEILIRQSGKASYGKEQQLVRVSDGEIHINKTAADNFGLAIHIVENDTP